MITAQNVAIDYDGKRTLEHIDFEVNRGDYLCIVGENGSGKTTLIKGLLGLLKLSGGQIKFTDLKQYEIGYLPQQRIVQKDFPASVSEVILSGCLNHHSRLSFYNKGDRDRAGQVMESLGIGPLKQKAYRDLSVGQQQRVLLARALCAAQKLLLLDEPMSGLDPIMTGELYDLLRELNQERRMTIIMISHDIGSAVKYGNKVLHLDRGPVFFGKTEDYIKTDMYRRITGGGGHA